MSEDREAADRPRDGHGRYFSTVEDAERDREAALLYRQVRNYQTVADQLGYSSRGNAWRAVERCKKAVHREGGEGIVEDEVAHLEELYAQAFDILERDHLTVSNGRVMKDDDGTPLLDSGPKLTAIRELRAIRESFRKLKGLDQPSRVSVDAESLGREIGELLAAWTESNDDGQHNP